MRPPIFADYLEWLVRQGGSYKREYSKTYDDVITTMTGPGGILAARDVGIMLDDILPLSRIEALDARLGLERTFIDDHRRTSETT